MIPQELLKFIPKPPSLQAGKKWHVYISYRSPNRQWALSLYDVLSEIGYKVFIDQYVLQPGDNFIRVLENALNESQAGILIWSSASADSAWVRSEYNSLESKSASSTSFQFLPIKIDNAPLPVFASNRIFLDFSGYPDGPNGGELIRLLYAISGMPISADAYRFISTQEEDLHDQIAKVNAAVRNNQPETLKELFKKGGLAWQISAALGCKAAEGLIKLRRYDDALSMLNQIEQQFKKTQRPRQLKALVLARRGETGDLEQAQQILGEMYSKNQADAETLGIYGRTWMDKYKKTGDINDLKQSRDLYAEAFEKSPEDYYTGINAASKSVLIGTAEDIQKGMEYARKVEAITGTAEVPGDYWRTATIAEILLLQKKYKEAADMYAKAIAMARSERGSHESTYKQARELMEKLSSSKEERLLIDSVFASVVAIENKKKVKVFISYSHKDVAELEELLSHLSGLEQSGRIELLLDRKLSPGDLWIEKLDQFIHEADIIIFLLSPDSLDSSYVNSEMQIALRQFEKGIGLALPVVLRPCAWLSSPLAAFQFLSFVNSDKSPISETGTGPGNVTWHIELALAVNKLASEITESWFTKVIRTELLKKTGELDLSGYSLPLVPWIVMRMTWLLTLNFSNNQLENLQAISKLVNLRKINLSTNSIKETIALEKLINLTDADLSYNLIQKTESFDSLKELTSLLLNNNQLKKIPALSGLTKLERLDLSTNEIDCIEGLNDLPALVYLNLSGNYIKKIEGLSDLTSLTDLRITLNKLERIEGLADLGNLKYLDLYDNSITTIEGLENNKQLKLLGLSSNKISKLENISHLNELETLYIAHNSIEDIGELRGLKKLKRVVLTNNKITDLIDIKEFIEKDIPVKAEYSYDINEPGFFVKENPIQYPPLEVLLQGKDAILRNFKQQEEALLEQLEAYQSNDIKLILIGNANVGKTHIATYIKTHRKDVPLNNASTHGMVNEFVEYNDGTSPLKIRILDFGGQEYYHDTHHLFFTSDTIYLLLWEKDTNKFDMRPELRYSIKTGKNEEEVNAIFPVAYWLDAVNYFISKRNEEDAMGKTTVQTVTSDTARPANNDRFVILVETKRDKKGGTLLDTSSILPYKNIIHSQVAISLYRDEMGNLIHTGTDSLFDSFRNLAGSMSEKRWSGYYKLIVEFFENISSTASNALLKKAKADKLIVNLNDCIELFDEIIRSKYYKYKFDNENGIDLCRFLANRGYVLYFDNDKICLFPEKLTAEIYAVLNIEYNNVGIITSKEALAHDLGVLTIMQDFKLLIRHPDGESFIAPQLLPESTNAQLKMFLDAFKPTVIRFIIVGYIHKNIVQELFHLFRKDLLKEDTQNYIWKNGFIVRIENDLYKININSQADARRIDVQYLKGPNLAVLDRISNVVKEALGKRAFKKEVSNDGELFVPVEMLNDNARLSQFLYKGKILRIAEYRDFLDKDTKRYAMKKLFISYSSKNTAFMRRFETHLAPMRRNGAIDFWHDRMIEPGTQWDESIKNEMRTADIVIFLLSPDFIATNYIFEVEIPQALKQFDEQKTKLFFVELQHCSWDQTILAGYQQTTDPSADNKGVITISEPLNDEKWKKVITLLQQKIDQE